jgi:hypothetical protein
MNGFQIAILVMLGVKLFVAGHMNGKPKAEEDHNFFGTLVNTALMLWVYYEAGLFNTLN